MHTPQLFDDLLIIILAALPVAYICLRLKLPLLVGLMLTGIAIGPYGLGFVRDLAGIELLAEIGVMLLLFTIGLEFSIARLREMKRLVLIGGGLQVGITLLAAAGTAVAFGRSVGQSVAFGFLIALSSTAIVLKTYVDRKEIDAPHGRVAVGILLFQDVCVVLMLLMIPVLAGQDEASLLSVLGSLGFSVGALVLIVFIAWLTIPPFLRQVVAMRSPEVFLLAIVLLCLGLSWITLQFGLSLALGAFIAGVVLADTDFSHQAIAEVLPFRDVFNSLFFVSIGMLLSLNTFIANIGSVAILVLSLIVGKAVIIWAIIRIMGNSQRVSVMAAVGLAQIGEFSFVIAKAARGVELIGDVDYQRFLAASIVSMIATPFLIARAPDLALLAQRFLKDGKISDVENVESDEIHLTSAGGLDNHVIIVGYGLNGRNLARVLRAVGLPYVVLDVNAEAVKKAKAEGEKINFGDATRREVLRHAGIEQASAMVLAMSDPNGVRLTLKLARRLNEDLYIIVRTRYVSEITDLYDLGANEVIPEEFETSIEIFSRVLMRFGIARNVIESQIEQIRKKGYRMLRSHSTPQLAGGIGDALNSASTETILLTDSSPAVDKDLGELNLREMTGATVIAVVRNGETVISPGAKYRLSAGDTVVLLGQPERLDKARKELSSESDPSGFNA